MLADYPRRRHLVFNTATGEGAKFAFLWDPSVPATIPQAHPAVARLVSGGFGQSVDGDDDADYHILSTAIALALCGIALDGESGKFAGIADKTLERCFDHASRFIDQRT